MKKILSSLTLISVLITLAIPLLASAQTQGPVECCQLRRGLTVDGVPYAKDDRVGPSVQAACPSGIVTKPTPNWGVICLLNTVNSVVDWIFMILIAAAVIMTLIGAITFITASGDPEKAMAARNYLIFALVGLIVALLARAIPNIIGAIAGF